MNGRIAILTAPRQIQIREYPVSPPGPGEILLQVEQTNICGSEVHVWSGQHPGIFRHVLGHELVGRVALVGPGRGTDSAGAPLAVGDLVTPTYFDTCHRCPSCARGEFFMCKNALLRWQNSPADPPHFIGSFATHYIVFPSQHCFKVPDNVPLSVAASANCALSQVMFGIDRVNPRAGSRAVVIGAGGLGLYASAVLHERGVKVVVLDRVAERLALAPQFGAKNAIDTSSVEPAKRLSVIEAAAGGTVDTVIEVAGSLAAFVEGLEYVRDGGQYLIMGNVWPGQNASIDPGFLGRRALQLHFLRMYNPWYLKLALDFLSRTVSQYPYEVFAAESFSLDQVEEALLRSERYQLARACLRPNP